MRRLKDGDAPKQVQLFNSPVLFFLMLDKLTDSLLIFAYR